MGKLYTENSIESLSPLEFTRLRPGVYCGSTEYSTQLLIEIVSNAVDEFKAGHGNTIKVDISNDNIISVEDNGQGFIPNVIRDDGKTVLEAAFSVLNTSGKYTEDGVYEGHTTNYIKVKATSEKDLTNVICTVTVAKAENEELFGAAKA